MCNLLHMSIAVDTALLQLPPEPWGRRLTRAREDVAGLTQSEALAIVGNYVATSDAMISRLESATERPTGQRTTRRLQLAFALCMIYGVDPAELDLSPNDLPPGLRGLIRKDRVEGTWYDENGALVTGYYHGARIIPLFATAA